MFRHMNVIFSGIRSMNALVKLVQAFFFHNVIHRIERYSNVNSVNEATSCCTINVVRIELFLCRLAALMFSFL
jgi:hypothetical protein